MVFLRSLSDSKSPQVSWTLLSILTDFNNVGVWMVSTCPFTNPLVTVPRAPITIGIIVTFPSKVKVFILLFTFFQFYSMVSRNCKVHSFASSLFLFFFLYFLLLWGLIVRPRFGDLFVSQNPRGVCASHSPGQMLGSAYTICSYCQVSIPSGSPCPPSRV